MMRHVWSIVLVLLPIACSNKVKEPPPNQVHLSATPRPSTSVAPKLPEPTVDLDGLPSEEDYEEEAEKAITPKNLLQQVDELEKQVHGKAP
jgi:hypothetical protein